MANACGCNALDMHAIVCHIEDCTIEVRESGVGRGLSPSAIVLASVVADLDESSGLHGTYVALNA